MKVPGVVVAVPLPQRRVPAVGSVVAPQSVSRVVGYCIQVIHSTLCMDRQTLRVNTSSPYSSNPADLSLLQVRLTAALRGELPQVQLFEGEVDVSGEFAGSDVRVGETLQVWEELSQGATGKGVTYDRGVRPPGPPSTFKCCIYFSCFILLFLWFLHCILICFQRCFVNKFGFKATFLNFCGLIKQTWSNVSRAERNCSIISHGKQSLEPLLIE